MIKVFYSLTGNSMRVVLGLEESGLSYTRQMIDITKGENRKPEYLSINPMGFVPAIIDEETSTTLTQSGAILLYIAEKAGRFMPDNPAQRNRALQWLFTIVSDIHPINRVIKYLGDSQASFESKMREDFANIQQSAFRALQDELGQKSFVLDEFSIVDIALYPIMRLRLPMLERAPGFEPLLEWYARMNERPAVKRAYAE